MTLDLNIDHLQLQIAGPPVGEHHLRPIARRAVDQLAARLAGRSEIDRPLPQRLHVAALEVPTIHLDLSRTSGEQAADAIAGAIVDAILLKLGI